MTAVELSIVAPAFVEMAHRIVWAVGATVDVAGQPSTRVLHPIWEWDGTQLLGWVLTSPQSAKARHLDRTPRVSFTYWQANQDTCTADCSTEWDETAELRAAGWRRFAEGPQPVGYDPSIIPGWESADAAAFGVLRLTPTSLRVMDGSLMLTGEGRLLMWRGA